MRVPWQAGRAAEQVLPAAGAPGHGSWYFRSGVVLTAGTNLSVAVELGLKSAAEAARASY